MAYYTGLANSFDDLMNALALSCETEGWLWQDGILSKGMAFLRPFTSQSGTAQGLLMQGGTGRSGAILINASPKAPRLGPPYAGYDFKNVTWPAVYHIHINEGPDEVYVLLNFSLTDFYWLAFGLSQVPQDGTGLWISAFSPQGRAPSTYAMTNHTGPQSNDGFVSPVIFGDQRVTGAHIIQSRADGTWEEYARAGAPGCNPMWHRSNTWNRQLVLSPIRDYAAAAASKYELRIDLAHARYVWLGEIESGSELTLGADVWNCYPFFRKSATDPLGSTAYQGSSGLMGWALRK